MISNFCRYSCIKAIYFLINYNDNNSEQFIKPNTILYEEIRNLIYYFKSRREVYKYQLKGNKMQNIILNRF